MKTIGTLKSEEISYVLNHAIVIKGNYINIFYTHKPTNKIAFLVSKSVKGAVHRNRARRRLREAWRKQSYTSNVKAHVCLLIKVESEKVHFNKIQDELEKLLKRIS